MSQRMSDGESASSRASDTSRRDFLKTSTAAVLTAGLSTGLARNAHAAGSDVLRLGLVGCGGRGAGAALQALKADEGTELVGLADAFPEPLEKTLKNLKDSEVAQRVRVEKDDRFVGFDAYKELLDKVDVVLLATPPHFRPLHLEAAVQAGKHVFAEKPVAVDAAGVRSVLATAEEARRKNLMIFSGLQWRFETHMQETVGRIHDGQIGEILSLESTRYHGGVGKLAKREPSWTDMEYQMRNWYYFTWLSGDFIVEQFIHELDKMAWVMRDKYPVRCTCVGGRQIRTAPEYGHIYDHFNAIYEYDDGVKLYAGTRHHDGCENVRLDMVTGTKGRCDLMKYTITGEKPWRLRDRATQMHQLEHNALFGYLRSGQIVNHGDYMAKSTLMAIMARESAYSGQTLTWDQMLQSKQDLRPPQYAWDISLPDPPVAVPGTTRFA